MQAGTYQSRLEIGDFESDSESLYRLRPRELTPRPAKTLETDQYASAIRRTEICRRHIAAHRCPDIEIARMVSAGHLGD